MWHETATDRGAWKKSGKGKPLPSRRTHTKLVKKKVVNIKIFYYNIVI